MIIRIEPPDLRGVMGALSRVPGALERAGRKAVTQTLKESKTLAGAKVAARYVVSPSFVTNTITTKVSGLQGEMRSTGARTPLERFKINPTSRQNPAPKGGVFAQVVRGQGGAISRAFLQSSGGVYERVKKARFPLKRFKSIAPPQALSNPVVSTYLINKMDERLVNNLMAAMGEVI